MRSSKMLALAGFAALSDASTNLAPWGFKNCPDNAKDTLDVLASDALENTGVVNSMLNLIEPDATPPATVVPGSLAANVRELVVRWFGEAALPEYDTGENDVHGYPFIKGMFDRMHTVLRKNVTEDEDSWLESPTFHCVFHSDMCIEPTDLKIQTVNGTNITARVFEPTGVVAYVDLAQLFEVHICPYLVDKLNQTWDQTREKLKTQAPDYYTWNERIGSRVIIHELTHTQGVSKWNNIIDIETAIVAAFRNQNIKLPRPGTYGPAAAQWLAFYEPDLAMYNADNFAGFASDMAFLNEGHMPPPWDWTLFGWPDGQKHASEGPRLRVKELSTQWSSNDAKKVHVLCGWAETYSCRGGK